MSEPLDEPHPEAPVKLYYRIGEVAAIVGVEPHVLRYWETEFRSIRPQKSRKGQRIYSRRDVERLLRVKDLLYNQGFTIAGARKRLREPAALAQAATQAESKPARAESSMLHPELGLLADASQTAWAESGATRVGPSPLDARAAPVRFRQTLLDARRELTALLAEIDRA